MGSSKKHKEKDKEKVKSKDKELLHKKKKVRTSSPTNGDAERVEPKEKSSKRSREKRKHSEKDGDDPVVEKSRRSNDSKGIATKSTPAAVPSRSPSPGSGGAEHLSLSIAETNKLRAKLGLKPLQVDKPPQAKSKKDLEEGEHDGDFDEETIQRIRAEREQEGTTFNWNEEHEFVHKPAENIGEKKKSEKIRERIAAVREKRRLEEKLTTGKGLADSDDEDATAWIEKSRKIAKQKELAAKRAKALDDLDDEFGVGDLVESEFQREKNRAYTAKDLKGMKVLHELGRFEEDSNVIMTLQDKGVLDEEDDVLVNPNMVDDEKYEKNLEIRKLRPELKGYNVFDDNEFDQFGNPKDKNLLSKYDEEISGVKKKSFTIGQTVTDEIEKAKIREKMQRSNMILDSLELPGLKRASDFYTSDEMVSFKKTKKKVRKVRKALKADDLLQMNADATDSAALSSTKKKLQDYGSRKKNASAAAGAPEMEVDAKTEPMDMEVDINIDDLPPAREINVSDVKFEDEGDIDFQLALNKARKKKQKDLVSKRSIDSILSIVKSERDDTGHSGMQYEENESIVLHATAEFCRTLGDIPTVEGADIYGDEEMDFEREESRRSEMEERGKWNVVEIDETPVDITRPPETEEAPILEQEPDVGAGVAGALKLAMKKGYLDQEKLKSRSGTKMKHLEAKNYSIEDKNYDDERSNKRDMYAGPVSEFKEKDGYKPSIKLDYVDEEGKPISSKEAFRLLSHKFHGKGSGKNKIDKKRRKFEQQKLMQHMNSTDTPLGTLELLQQRQKETHSAFIILSGNKAAQNASLAKQHKR